MAQEQNSLFDEIPDPTDTENAVASQDQMAVQKANDWQSRSMAVGAQGINQAANSLSQATGNPNVGDPRVVQARRISSVMQDIVNGANKLPTDTDPIDKNLYVAQQVSQRMWDVSPSLAGKAMLQAQQLQEAKSQQSKLAAQTTEAQVKTAGLVQQQKITDLTNKNAVLVDNQGNIVWSHPTEDPGFTD